MPGRRGVLSPRPAGLTHSCGLGGRWSLDHRSSGLHAYVLDRLGGRASCLVALLCQQAGRRPCCSSRRVFWVLLASLVVIESFPILRCSAGRHPAVTTAETFAFAILLGWGTTAAVSPWPWRVLVSDAAPPGRAREGGLQRRPVRPAHGRRRRRLRAPRRRASLHGQASSRRSRRPRSSSSSATSSWSAWSPPSPTGATSSPTSRSASGSRPGRTRWSSAWPRSCWWWPSRASALLPLVLLPLFAVRDALQTAEEAEEHRAAAEQAAERGHGGGGRARPGSPRPSTPWSSGCGRATGSRTTCWPPSPTSCAPRWPACWARWPP